MSRDVVSPAVRTMLPHAALFTLRVEEPDSPEKYLRIYFASHPRRP
jgi:hypothetical protein